MDYISTRGQAPALDFAGATLAGLASDGGLYVPREWPRFSADEIAAMAGLPYAQPAQRIMQPFVGDSIAPARLLELTTAAYGRFAHAAVTPLKQFDEQQWLLELFHGPTLAFKDVALQLLGLLFEEFLARGDQNLTIVGATSGDTGSAAIDAVAGRAKVDIFMLHPKGRVSDVQRRQMTTVLAPNVHNIALEGTSFDDAQAMVKRMFNDPGMTGRFNIGAVNSINWARLMAQVVYYFAAALQLGAPHGQFRRCVCRIRRRANGPADRAADRGHQCERHPPPRAFQRRLFARHSKAHRRTEHGHSGVVEFRAAAV